MPIGDSFSEWWTWGHQPTLRTPMKGFIARSYQRGQREALNNSQDIFPCYHIQFIGSSYNRLGERTWYRTTDHSLQQVAVSTNPPSGNWLYEKNQQEAINSQQGFCVLSHTIVLLAIIYHCIGYHIPWCCWPLYWLSYTIRLARITDWRQADSNRWHPPKGEP